MYNRFGKHAVRSPTASGCNNEINNDRNNDAPVFSLLRTNPAPAPHRPFLSPTNQRGLKHLGGRGRGERQGAKLVGVQLYVSIAEERTSSCEGRLVTAPGPKAVGIPSLTYTSVVRVCSLLPLLRNHLRIICLFIVCRASSIPAFCSGTVLSNVLQLQAPSRLRSPFGAVSVRRRRRVLAELYWQFLTNAKNYLFCMF